MDGQKDRLKGDREHIWLRYATEFTSGGRRHTIEMGVPMPLGANDEERERLLNEAEQGMQQLIGRVEKRANQAFQRAQSGLTGSTQTSQSGRPAQAPQKPASLPAPQTSVQPSPKTSQIRESAAPQTEAEEVQVPTGRAGIGPLPSTPTATGDQGGDMHLTDFLHYIKETWGIESREAMQYLNVRSLSTINRRAAVSRLHELLDKEQRTGRGTGPQASQRPARSSERPHTAPSVDTQPPQIQNRASVADVDVPMSSSVSSVQTASDQPARLAQAIRSVPEGANGHTPSAKIVEVMAPVERLRPVRAFDEEIEPEDLEGLTDLEEIGAASAPSALMHLAYDKLHQLREIKGATVVREHRLKVLSNVIGEQISEAQLQKLIEGIWGVPTLKKLKLDQNEALITWAKEDDFVPEAEAVLQLLEEEQ